MQICLDFAAGIIVWHNYPIMTRPSAFSNPEELWNRLLSRETGLIRAAFASLSAEQKAAVLAHLTRMAEESGWHDEQRASALAALDALAENPPAQPS